MRNYKQNFKLYDKYMRIINFELGIHEKSIK